MPPPPPPFFTTVHPNRKTPPFQRILTDPLPFSPIYNGYFLLSTKIFFLPSFPLVLTRDRVCNKLFFPLPPPSTLLGSKCATHFSPDLVAVGKFSFYWSLVGSDIILLPLFFLVEEIRNSLPPPFEGNSDPFPLSIPLTA